MACAKALGIGYQSFRLKLSQKGEYIHEGRTYVTIGKVYSREISYTATQGPTEVDPADQQPAALVVVLLPKRKDGADLSISASSNAIEY